MAVELIFNLRVRDKGVPLTILVDNDVVPYHEKISIKKLIDVVELLENDRIKIFSISGITQGKEQEISVESIQLNGRSYEDFHGFCSFNMINNKFVKNGFLRNQNVICFSGDFYFDCSNKNKIKYFSTYYSNKEDDFIFWNGFLDCENDLGCITGETPHINSWSNVPYDIKKIKSKDVFDVACFGCSITYGHGVSKKQIWSSLVKDQHSEGLSIINLGLSAGGIDSIYNNLKNSIREFHLKKIIFLLPNLERRFLKMSSHGYFFKIPITVNTNINAILPNIWFSDDHLREEIRKIEQLIVLDKKNEYSKNILMMMMDLLRDEKINYLMSSWDNNCYKFLEDSIEKDNLLTYFNRIDFAIDGFHPGPNSHSHWVNENKEKLSFFKTFE